MTKRSDRFGWKADTVEILPDVAALPEETLQADPALSESLAISARQEPR